VTIEIHPATVQDLPTIRELFREYVTWLGVDLSFQGFEEELATLPGKYAHPAGRILVARARTGGPAGGDPGKGVTVAGCVAMRPLDPPRCEMKRLWVREPFRKLGVGRLLVRSILREARAAGYTSMVLDTLDRMIPARHLYESAGFREIDAYYDNPLPGAVYLGIRL